jgi:glycosyltransferase involved in cell wall biosynthesis
VSIPNTDGTSISLLEAMAYACIPFVSNLPANKEWVKDGENGFVVDAGELEKSLLKFNGFDVKTAIQINQNLIQTKASKSVNRLLFYSIYDKILKN